MASCRLQRLPAPTNCSPAFSSLLLAAFAVAAAFAVLENHIAAVDLVLRGEGGGDVFWAVVEQMVYGPGVGVCL